MPDTVRHWAFLLVSENDALDSLIALPHSVKQITGGHGVHGKYPRDETLTNDCNYNGCILS